MIGCTNFVAPVTNTKVACHILYFMHNVIYQSGSQAGSRLGSKILAPFPHRWVSGLVQERHNSSALVMELRLSCTNPSICFTCSQGYLTHWSLRKIGCFKNIFYFIFIINTNSMSAEMHWDLFHKWTLVRVVAWCQQATSYYLNQFWLRSLIWYGLTRPKWVNKYGHLWLTFSIFLDVHFCSLL